MRQRTLGRLGPAVSEIGFGCMSLGIADVYRSITPSQLALAWLLARGDDIVPIPGTSSAARLQENVAAAEVQLSPAELAQLDAIAPKGAAHGERYAPDAARYLNR